MNRKAFGFIIRGMLAEEAEVTVERIGHMLSTIENAADMLCDGIVVNATVTSNEALFVYVKQSNKDKVLNKLISTEVRYDGVGRIIIEVTVERTVWKKEGGKGWDSRNQQSDEYNTKVVEPWKDCIYITDVTTQIPGVKVTVI